MKIIVKVGTQSILSAEGIPLHPVLSDMIEQIVQLKNSGVQVVLVTSGAVGYGRSVARQMLGKEYGSSIGEKQVLASLGQHKLMHVYTELLKPHNMLASQLLLTKQDFHTRKHYLNISRLITEILNHKNIIPIINENDSVAIEELMFTDNDELAGLIAAQVNADKLIILSNIEGVYTNHPSDPAAQLIQVIDLESSGPKISTVKSSQGRGGMVSKLGTARKMSNLGIMTHIAAINQPLVLSRLINNEQVGTTILPAKRKSNLKRWIAVNTEQTNGKIYINTCLHEILRENKRIISLLPIGIEKSIGDFKKGDVIEIVAPNKTVIGIGLARYDSNKLKDYLGLKDKPVFIHYDHLHIF
jgi:glutamate 5-kinase